MEDYLSLLWPLGLSILIEYIIVQTLWLILFEKKENDNKTKFLFFGNKFILIPVIIVNVLTNPAINIMARYLWRNTQLEDDIIWIIITIVEVFVWVFEGALYKFMLKTKWSNAFILSFSANIASYLSSFLL